MFRLVTISRIIGEGVHHSGWPFVVNHLKKHIQPDGILVDEFVDRLIYGMELPKELPYEEPWIGIFHHPGLAPEWCPQLYQQSLSRWLRSSSFSRVRNTLIHAVTFSEDAASVIRRFVSVPVTVLRHPIDEPREHWSLDAYRLDPVLYQPGYYGRNCRAIFHVPPTPGVHYLRTRTKTCGFDFHDNFCKHFYRAFRTEHPGVDDCEFVAPHLYDHFLTRSAVLMEFMASNANNVLIECIVRHTPVLLNRLPAVEEYLGKAYPLYYEELEEVPEMLDPDRLVTASEYLARLDKTSLRVGTFVASFLDLVRQHSEAPGKRRPANIR